MKIKTLTTATLAFALVTSQGLAFAAESQNARPMRPDVERGIGFGAGGIIGALVAGPFGFFGGALLGTLITDNDAKHKELHTQHVALLNQQLQLQSTNRELAGTQQENADLRATGQRLAGQIDKLRNLRGTYAMDVLFRTGSSDVEPLTQQHLAELAAFLKQVPDIRIHINGYADERGTGQRNLVLSENRANAVRHALLAAGIPETRIEVDWYGDKMARAKAGDPDGLALDRRATIVFSAGGKPADNLAQNQP